MPAPKKIPPVLGWPFDFPAFFPGAARLEWHMVFPRQWWMVCLVLFLSTRAVWAAGGTREQRAYDAGVQAFHDGVWPLAEMDFAQFAEKYPDSKLLPSAGLLHAQALIKQNKFILAEELLVARRPVAGTLTDDYTYWLGEAQFQAGDWRSAADTLSSLPPGSSRALAGAVGAGAAMAKLELWPRLASYMQAEQPLFHAAEQTDPDNELVLRGRLLLAQARFGQGAYREAGQLLENFKPGILPSDLEWQRINLLCQVKLGAGELDAALPLATELVRLAGQAAGGADVNRLAASVALQARVLEQLGRGPEAMVALQANLATNAPPDRQQEAILKIAELAIAQRQFTNAESVLEDFASRFSNSPAVPAAWLALGELYLQDYVAQPMQTNRLADARVRFAQLLATYTNNAFTGKAYLDLGWCDWLAQDYAASLANFQNATLNLPPSEDLAVARFKLADAQFATGNYAAALGNYQNVLGTLTNEFPRVAESLGTRSLYQSFRTQLELGHLGEAETTMARLAADYPQSALNETTALLLGQQYTDLSDPTNARAVFQAFKERLPQSALMPLVDLALARAEEEDHRWPEALAQYARWLSAYPTNALLPLVRYSQAWANYQAGNDTNALMLFTNFVAQFPGSDLAPQAQWWVADYYFSQGVWTAAELNYKAIFENPNWLTNALYYPAKLMAGQAAVSRTGNDEAIRLYFEKLEADTNCPLDLRVRATFAHGRALMGMESADTNDPTANFQKAVTVFDTIRTAFPTNELGARAWGEMGDCYLQLTNYDAATNAYAQALATAGSNVVVASQAQFGLGLALEKQAALLPEGRTNLNYQALANYLAVFNADGPERDPFWTQKAGLQAAELATALGEWQQVTNLYTSLARQFPQLKTVLAAKAALVGQNLSPPGR